MQIIFRKGFYSEFHFELRKSYPLARIFTWIILLLLLLLLFSKFYVLLLVIHLFIICCCTKGAHQFKKSRTMIQEVVLHMYYLFTLFADLIFNLHIHYILLLLVFFQFDFVRGPVIPNPREEG